MDLNSRPDMMSVDSIKSVDAITAWILTLALPIFFAAFGALVACELRMHDTIPSHLCAEPGCLLNQTSFVRFRQYVPGSFGFFVLAGGLVGGLGGRPFAAVPVLEIYVWSVLVPCGALMVVQHLLMHKQRAAGHQLGDVRTLGICTCGQLCFIGLYALFRSAAKGELGPGGALEGAAGQANLALALVDVGLFGLIPLIMLVRAASALVACFGGEKGRSWYTTFTWRYFRLDLCSRFKSDVQVKPTLSITVLAIRAVLKMHKMQHLENQDKQE